MDKYIQSPHNETCHQQKLIIMILFCYLAYLIVFFQIDIGLIRKSIKKNKVLLCQVQKNIHQLITNFPLQYIIHSAMRKQSQDDEGGLDMTGGLNLKMKVDKMSVRSEKMHNKINQIIAKAIQAIDQSEKQIMMQEQNIGNSILNLHIKMTQIKPLRSIKEQYGDFYKKLSGLGKGIEQGNYENQIKIDSPKLFDEKDIKSIQQSLSDHYLSQRNYQAANIIYPLNEKKKLFQECFLLKQNILTQNFDQPIQWIEKAGMKKQQESLTYQLQKLKVVKLVKQSKADEAIAYLRKNLSEFTAYHGNQISKLMSFIITQSQKYWGAEDDYLSIYKNRYNSFLTTSLQDLANKFVSIYLKKNQIYLANPIEACHEIGVKFKTDFLDHLRYLPQDQQELPKILPFSIKTGPDAKYHSQFFCPINKEIYGPVDKNIVLNCGHMISDAAMTKMIEGKDTRRKIKCPICQSDQILQHNLKVQF